MNIIHRLFFFLVLFLIIPKFLEGVDSSWLYLDVYPRSAECYLGDNKIDHQLPISIEPGTYTMKVKHPAYPDYDQIVRVDADSVWVSVYPVKVLYAPSDARLIFNGKLMQYDDQNAAYLLCSPGSYSITVSQGRLTNSKEIDLASPYTVYRISALKPRYEDSIWGHILSPGLVFYPATGNLAISVAGLGVKAEGKFGKTKLHYGLGILDGSFGIPSSYALSLFTGETGFNYHSVSGYSKVSLLYKLNVMEMEWGSADQYEGDYIPPPPDNGYSYEAYKINDAYCILSPNKSTTHRFCLSYSHYFSDKVDLTFSVGVYLSNHYTWFRAQHWSVPESERDYLTTKEIMQISPFPEGTQPYISISLRPITFHRPRND